jgi:mono/diheme cytochrome c family protein
VRSLLLPLFLLVACNTDKDTSDDTAADTDTDTDTDPDTDTDTDTSDTDTDTDTDTSDTDTDTDTDTAPPPPDGAALYTATCATCHGADGKGTGENPDITGELGKPDDELIGIIRNGKGDMPAQTLDDAEALAVIEWMRANF